MNLEFTVNIYNLTRWFNSVVTPGGDNHDPLLRSGVAMEDKYGAQEQLEGLSEHKEECT